MVSFDEYHLDHIGKDLNHTTTHPPPCLPTRGPQKLPPETLHPYKSSHVYFRYSAPYSPSIYAHLASAASSRPGTYTQTLCIITLSPDGRAAFPPGYGQAIPTPHLMLYSHQLRSSDQRNIFNPQLRARSSRSPRRNLPSETCILRLR